MTADRPATEPRTEAGRRMLHRRSYWSGNNAIREAILAIEAEAAQGAAPLVYLPLDCPVCGRRRVEWDGKVLRCEKCTTSSEWDGFSKERYEGAAPRAEGLLLAEQGPCTTECCDLQDVRHFTPLPAHPMSAKENPMTADRPATEPLARDAHVCRTCDGLHYHDEAAPSVDELRARIEAEPFFPNHDGPTHGNAAAFRDYRRRILSLLSGAPQEGRAE